jgi:hypothetical protein
VGLRTRPVVRAAVGVNCLAYCALGGDLPRMTEVVDTERDGRRLVPCGGGQDWTFAVATATG